MTVTGPTATTTIASPVLTLVQPARQTHVVDIGGGGGFCAYGQAVPGLGAGAGGAGA
ncbi:hypothetical protein [Streptomyces sp900116325]|uniref:Uncharacterized protein n=1 Tax=Streptomyces sp. 900116325 TaxID=3154295 RepID=A0ABV2UBK4_9ACTN